MPEILKKLIEAGKITEDEAKQLQEEIVKEQQAKLQELQQELEKYKAEATKTKEILEAERAKLQEELEKAKKEGNLDKIKEYEAKLGEKEQQLAELQKTITQLKVENTLNKALDKFNVIDKELVAEALKNRVKVDEQGNILIGDKPIEEGLKEFFESKPHLLKAQGQGGAGAGAQGGASSFKGAKRRSEMSDVEKAEFIKQHGQEAYLNLPE